MRKRLKTVKKGRPKPKAKNEATSSPSDSTANSSATSNDEVNKVTSCMFIILMNVFLHFQSSFFLLFHSVHPVHSFWALLWFCLFFSGEFARQ